MVGGVLKERTYIYYHTHNIMKKCQTCKEIKPLTDFCKSKMMADGHHNQCKSCVKVYQLANKDKLKAYQKEYQKVYKVEHKEELEAYLSNYFKTTYKEKHRAYVNRWRAANPEKVKQYKAIAYQRAKAKQQNGQ